MSSSSPPRPRKRASIAAASDKGIAEQLHDDLWLQILSRLPPKSLFCCACVSKRWKHLISDDHEARKHLPPLMSGLFFSRWSKFSQFIPQNGSNSCTPISLINTDNLNILSCCNGLLLCTTVREAKEASLHQRDPKHRQPYIVCNPARRKLQVLPLHRNDGIFYAVGIAHDRAHSFKVVQYFCQDWGSK